MIDAETVVSFSEAVDLMELPASEAEILLGSKALSPGPDGALRLFQVMGAGLLPRLAFLDPRSACALAVMASQQARVGGTRALMSIWPNGLEPVPFWLETPGGLAAPQPVMGIPADKMLTTLANRLAVLRGSMSRPN